VGALVFTSGMNYVMPVLLISAGLALLYFTFRPRLS
jgi:hypothetical protein